MNMDEARVFGPDKASQDAGQGGRRRWGMVIDLNRCVGCQTCTIACKHANDTTPGVQWRRVIDVEQGSFPNVERMFVVTGCQHCAEPPCVPVCPTGATRQREDGLVTIDYDMCIGCAYCVVSCPYQARTIEHHPKGYYGQSLTLQEQATAHPERAGVAQKCTFCQGRIDAGVAKGLVPGVDLEATPACAASCISQAIRFGDFNDPDSTVSQLVREQPSLQINEELGTNPQIRYLYTTPAVPGRELQDEDEERLADPENPLVGQLQTFWDWRAAMNWIFGGAGTGLAVFSGLLAAGGAISPRAGQWMAALSMLLVATGLFFVFLKIGRKLRFWRAVSRPQTSWMTRELYVAMLMFPTALAAIALARPWLFAALALLAAAFLYCQARILHRARGIPAWRAPGMPAMIVASGALEGWGALAVAASLAGVSLPAAVLMAGLLAALVNAMLWRMYLAHAKANGIAPLSRAALARIALPLGIVGHAVPALLALAAWLWPGAQGALLVAGGVAAVAGGAMWKFTLIVRAGHMQGFSLRKLPQRGSGALAAPIRLEGAGTDFRELTRV